ncbi:MAG: 6-phosphogluconolactonase [Pseudomonadota bacterium]
MMVQIESIPTAEAWAQTIAGRLEETLGAAVVANGRAIFAGPGGSTPSPVYARLAQADIGWDRIAVTLVDERYVPETSPESNARLIKHVLSQGPASKATFIPLYHSEVTVDRAAAVAGNALAVAGGHLDAVLLGMGEDGHICSMFPNSPTLKTLLSPTLRPSVYGVPHGRDGAAPSLERLSINLRYLMSAGRVILALKGAAKRSVFEREAEGDPATQPIAAMIAAKVPLEVVWTEAN